MKNEDLELVKYDQILEEEYIDYINEWEKTSEKIEPGITYKKDLGFDILLKWWTKQELDTPEGFVPSTLYFLKNTQNKILGAIHFRHQLNDSLKLNGGHIGYGIRPIERRKGYALIMLEKLLIIIKGKNYDKVLLTCNDDNIGSIRTIEKCHGILQDKSIFEGTLTRRYWISL